MKVFKVWAKLVDYEEYINAKKAENSGNSYNNSNNNEFRKIDKEFKEEILYNDFHNENINQI